MSEESEAYQKGKEEGRRLGYEESLWELRSVYALLQQVATKLLEKRERLFQESKPDLIAFATKAAEQVIRDELRDPEHLSRLVETNLGAFTQEDQVRLFLAPADLLLLEHHITYDRRAIKSLLIASDPTLPQGDFRIETRRALLHFDLEREMDGLREEVLKL